MPRGGAREGAGRKKGLPSVKIKDRLSVVEKAMAQGITPIEVLLNTMRQLYASGQLMEAAKVAGDAAPYCHSKLASIELTGDEERPTHHVFTWKK